MTPASPGLRPFIVEPAQSCCEYCLLRQETKFFSFEVDHIIAEKHGGATDAANLCLSCPERNGYKGSDTASVDPASGRLSRLFNPRIDNWADHFYLNDNAIEGLTAEGRATVFLLRLNLPDRVKERAELAMRGLYPGRAYAERASLASPQRTEGA